MFLSPSSLSFAVIAIQKLQARIVLNWRLIHWPLFNRQWIVWVAFASSRTALHKGMKIYSCRRFCRHRSEHLNYGPAMINHLFSAEICIHHPARPRTRLHAIFNLQLRLLYSFAISFCLCTVQRPIDCARFVVFAIRNTKLQTKRNNLNHKMPIKVEKSQGMHFRVINFDFMMWTHLPDRWAVVSRRPQL